MQNIWLRIVGSATAECEDLSAWSNQADGALRSDSTVVPHLSPHFAPRVSAVGGRETPFIGGESLHVGIISQSSTNRDLVSSAFTPVKAEYAAQRAAFVPPLGGISCAATAALSYAHRADFITGLPVYFIERSDWFPLH